MQDAELIRLLSQWNTEMYSYIYPWILREMSAQSGLHYNSSFMEISWEANCKEARGRHE